MSKRLIAQELERLPENDLDIGFVSILGSKGGEKVESSKNAAGHGRYKIAK